jgi:hypothetical protein
MTIAVEEERIRSLPDNHLVRELRALGKLRRDRRDETEDLPPVLGETIASVLDRASKLRKTR